MPAKVITPAAFYEFAAKRSELFGENIYSAIKHLRQHQIYRWLRANPHYRVAEKRLAATAAFRAQSPAGWPQEWELLFFGSLVAQCLGEYWQTRSNPTRGRVITKDDRKAAKKAAVALTTFIERGLEVGRPGDTSKLYELLEKVPVSANVVASRKKGGHVPAQTFARVLGQMLYAHYGEIVPGIVHKAVQIVEPTASLRAVRRQLGALSVGTQKVDSA